MTLLFGRYGRIRTLLCLKKNSSPWSVMLSAVHVFSQQTVTPNHTITTSILNKITPPVPVWLLGRVWEHGRRDKPPVDARSPLHMPAQSIGDELLGDRSQVCSPQEHTGNENEDTELLLKPLTTMSEARAN